MAEILLQFVLTHAGLNRLRKYFCILANLSDKALLLFESTEMKLVVQDDRDHIANRSKVVMWLSANEIQEYECNRCGSIILNLQEVKAALLAARSENFDLKIVIDCDENNVMRIILQCHVTGYNEEHFLDQLDADLLHFLHDRVNILPKVDLFKVSASFLRDAVAFFMCYEIPIQLVLQHNVVAIGVPHEMFDVPVDSYLLNRDFVRNYSRYVITMPAAYFATMLGASACSQTVCFWAHLNQAGNPIAVSHYYSVLFEFAGMHVMVLTIFNG